MDEHTLKAAALACRLNRSDVSALSGQLTRMEVAVIDRSLTDLLDDAHISAATALAFAAIASGHGVSSHHLTRLVEVVDQINYVPGLLAGARDDPSEALLADATSERLAWERLAMMLYCLARLDSGGHHAEALGTAIRRLARKRLGHEASLLLGCAAGLLDDDGVREVAKTHELKAHVMAQGLRNHIDPLLEGDPLTALPDEGARVLVQGRTAVRAADKIGRNAPCPCGSGKKYKKCCRGKEGQSGFLSEPGKTMTQEQFLDLRPHEYAALDFTVLPTDYLCIAFNRLVLHRRLDAAEQAFAAMEERTDLPVLSTLNSYRHDLIEALRDADALERAAEHTAKLDEDDAELTTDLALEVALVQSDPGPLQMLEHAVLMAMQKDDGGAEIELAFLLLRRLPALGILAARAALRSDRLLDADTLVREIGAARDRLGLSPVDPAAETLELLYEATYMEHLDLTPPDISVRPASEDLEQLERVRREQLAAERRVTDLAGQLQSLKRQIRSAERAAEVTSGSSASLEVEAQTLTRLRSKVDELKGLIAAGNAERAELRDALTTQVAHEQAPSTLEADTVDDVERPLDDDLLETAELSNHRGLLVPVFTSRARRQLALLPELVGAAALSCIGRLAARELGAWQGVKALARNRHIFSVRVARTYRLLFRVVSDTKDLQVETIVHRRDLAEAVERLA